ncbi:MAG: DUF5777 family beta-barrel protein [Bacteroidota bacterium]
MKKHLHLIFLVSLLLSSLNSYGQENVYQTFKDTRVINSHTVETVPERKLDFRIGHRFGETNGGWNTLWGLENATDVLFGFELGISDDLTLGISRTKGSGELRALVNPSVKYRIIRQKTEGGSPVSLTLMGVGSISTMKSVDSDGSLANFGKFAHRISYTAQALIARKFSDRFSLQIMPGYTHRNRVNFNDVNGIFSLGAATRIQINKVFGIIADFTMPFADRPTESDGSRRYFAPLGIGLEIETGGHVFQINFTNTSGIIENDYIPYTTSNWGDNEFRLGFTISRLFNL